VAGTQFHPGIAAVVADKSITVNDIDSLATRYCTAIKPQIQQQHELLPMRYLRSGIAGELVIRDAAQQLADEYDVQPDDQYNQAVSQSQAGTSTLDKDTAAAVVEVDTIDPYVTAILTAVGAKKLPTSGGASTDDQLAAGKKVMAAWFASHQVDIDPRFGIQLKDNEPVAADTDLSLAVSTTAKEGMAQQPSQGYAAALPSSAVCG
jgi:hypothetical protein